MKKKKKMHRGEPQMLWKDLFNFLLRVLRTLECWMLRCITLFSIKDKGIMKTLTLFLVTRMSPCEPPKIDHSMNHGSQNQINKTRKNGPLPHQITTLHEQLKPPCLVSYSPKCQWCVSSQTC